MYMGKASNRENAKGNDALFELLTQAHVMGITGIYLLFGRWFAHPVVLLKALEHSMDEVCIPKAMPKVRYALKDVVWC
jgi:hypothetical protein